MNPSRKRKVENRKMKATFEWNDWPVPTPQFFHHWTGARHVDHLFTARGAETDLSFMARLMALCALASTNSGRGREYVLCNGPYTLVYDRWLRIPSSFRKSAPPPVDLVFATCGGAP